MPPTNMSLSPPPSTSGGEILQHGLHHILQHNANSPYPQEQYQPDETVHLRPNYGSPTPGPDEMYGFCDQQPRFIYLQQHQDSGLRMPYESYNSEYQGSVYQDQYSTPATSPPTPSMSSHNVTKSRSEYSIQRTNQNPRPKPEARPRTEKALKTKKAKKEKAKAEKKIVKLEKPLSELTKDWTHVPIADIESYVNRSAEERRREVEDGKVPGKVKRPMNSFMLYRKAYQNRTKDWCLQNNHQIVSQVCGDSWPLEPESVKEQFSEWARIERQNHQNAHPGYKFSPSKPGATKATTKRKAFQDPRSEELELEDFEWQDAQPRKPKKPRSAPLLEQLVPYPTTRSAYQYLSRGSSAEVSYGSYNKSSYQATNPGKPIPPLYNQAKLDAGQYYQQSIQSNPSIAGVEDVIIRKTASPGVHSYLGLPGGQDYDVLNVYQPYEGVLEHELRIDPSLMAQDHAASGSELYSGRCPEGAYFDGNVNSPSGDTNWQQQTYGMGDHNDPGRQQPALNYLGPELTVTNMRIEDHHMHVLKGHQDAWQVDSLEAHQEFEKWMNEE